MVKTAAQRQRDYAEKLKNEGRITLKITFGPESSAQLLELDGLMKGKSKKEIIEWALDRFYKTAKQAIVNDEKRKNEEKRS